jgi:hypothetical protein
MYRKFSLNEKSPRIQVTEYLMPKLGPSEIERRELPKVQKALKTESLNFREGQAEGINVRAQEGLKGRRNGFFPILNCGF